MNELALDSIHEVLNPTVIENDRLWEIDTGDSGLIPRLRDDNNRRINRLKALGNGQIPHI